MNALHDLMMFHSRTHTHTLSLSPSLFPLPPSLSLSLFLFIQRPVYKSASTNQRWCRIKTSVRFLKENETPNNNNNNSSSAQLFFEHSIDSNEQDKLYFAFTYPYTYTQLQQELDELDLQYTCTYGTPEQQQREQEQESNTGEQDKELIFYRRELLTRSCDGRRIDLLTISSMEGVQWSSHEPLLPSLFPDMKKIHERVPCFPQKEVIFISARVHSGEVPAQHTFKGILDILMDPNDLCGKELRSRYVFKLIPMLNPDGKCDFFFHCFD
jgi:hypothetical protein